MKRQVWLRTNRRALWLSAVPAVCLLILGGGLALATSFRWVGIACQLLGGLLLAATAVAATRPRLALRDNDLLIYLTLGKPLAVPVDVVECFFLGSGPANIVAGSGDPSPHGVKTQTIVVRLAEAATQWREADVQPQLGKWSDGYITIRGTWCEPIGPSLVLGLNERLKQAHRRFAHQQGD